jgi:selenocysteine-specific translation elongation factor
LEKIESVFLKSINFVILGDYNSIAGELGKKGTATDIAIYDRKTSDVIYTWAAPVTFPDKIQSLMQTISIAEYAILNVTKIDKYLGEQIIALDSVDFKDGFILHSYEVDEEKLRTLIKNTSVSHFKFLDNTDQLKQEISRLESKVCEGPVMIPVDHAFDVKGVGTVVLGVVKQGTVKVYDQLRIMPAGNDIVVKSIQMHDDPVHESKSPARVGLAVKGMTAEQISRGDVLCLPNSSYMKTIPAAGATTTITTTTISTGPTISTTKFVKNSYYKGDLAENQTYLISVGLQIKPVRLKLVNGTAVEKIIPESKPIVFFPGQIYALLKPDSQGTRIIGKGILE